MLSGVNVIIVNNIFNTKKHMSSKCDSIYGNSVIFIEISNVHLYNNEYGKKCIGTDRA